jgi:hypothetical protein
VQALYPGGVPEGLIAEAKRGAAVKLVLVGIGSQGGAAQAAFPEREQALLEAAVTKGLKLDLSQVQFLNAAAQELQAERLFTQSRGEIVVLLGPQVFDRVFAGESFAALRGQIKEVAGKQVLVTYGPDQVLGSQEIKRAFWEDLRQLMGVL